MKNTSLTAREKEMLTFIAELVIRQHEALSIVSGVLGINAWDYWMGAVGYEFNSEDELGEVENYDRGETPDKEWQWYFHGYEIDICNTKDKRSLRVDFGPNHRVDTFTPWGVWLFSPESPWRTFPQLEEYFNRDIENPNFNIFNAEAQNRAHNLLFQLEEKGYIKGLEGEERNGLKEITHKGWRLLYKRPFKLRDDFKN